MFIYKLGKPNFMKDASKEDYLKAIYHLGKEESKNTKSIEISKYLKVSKPTVSEMLRKLADNNLVKFNNAIFTRAAEALAGATQDLSTEKIIPNKPIIYHSLNISLANDQLFC